MQEKTSLIETTASALGLHVNRNKTTVNIITNNSPIEIQLEVLGEIQTHTFKGEWWTYIAEQIVTQALESGKQGQQ